MKACGLGQPSGTNEPLDHIATECEFLEYLAAVSAGISDPVKTAPAASDIPGGSYENAYSEFFQEHAATWMPRFSQDVIAKTRLPFYLSAALLLGALLEGHPDGSARDR